MDRKELRKLSRGEILEIMLVQTDKIKALEQEITKLKKELSNRSLSISNAGSLAEASISISGIFQKADEAIKIYEDNYYNQMKKKFEKDQKEMLKNSEKICKKNEKASIDLLKKAEEKANKIIEDAKKEKENILKEIKKGNKAKPKSIKNTSKNRKKL